MWKVTRKGLAAHKLRFALTALAVFLGVAFMSGTIVLTATIQSTFDNLFSDIYHGTDAVVRAKPAGSKGVYLRTFNVASTMGPGIELDQQGTLALASSET